jgi:hypothetical protein
MSARCCVGRIADGYHWTGHSIGAALFQHAEQLAKFARVRNHNSSSAQVFRHPNLSLSRYSPALASELISSPDGSTFAIEGCPQPPMPGLGENRLALSGLPSRSLASGGGSRFTVMFGQI